MAARETKNVCDSISFFACPNRKNCVSLLHETKTVMKTKMVSPSMLAADFGNLERDISMLNASHCDWIHLDVMDGVFVPNISFGFPVMEAMAKVAKKPLDVHLMIVHPEKFIHEVKALGTYMMSVHQEACPHLHRVVQQIKNVGMKAGVVLNPATPLCMIEEVLTNVDMILLMAVNPGFGGQKFIPQTLDKIKRLRQMLDAVQSDALIEIDGGVSRFNANELYDAGANVLVAGSAVFNASDPIAEIDALKA